MLQIFFIVKQLWLHIICYSFDGTDFVKNIEKGVSYKKRKNKRPRQIRHSFYCAWALQLLRAEIGPADSTYTFPPSVLKYLRCVCPGNIVGEIRDDSYKVNMLEFCNALNLKPISQGISCHVRFVYKYDIKILDKDPMILWFICSSTFLRVLSDSVIWRTFFSNG